MPAELKTPERMLAKWQKLGATLLYELSRERSTSLTDDEIYSLATYAVRFLDQGRELHLSNADLELALHHFFLQHQEILWQRRPMIMGQGLSVEELSTPAVMDLTKISEKFRRLQAIVEALGSDELKQAFATASQERFDMIANFLVSCEITGFWYREEEAIGIALYQYLIWGLILNQNDILDRKDKRKELATPMRLKTEQSPLAPLEFVINETVQVLRLCPNDQLRASIVQMLHDTWVSSDDALHEANADTSFAEMLEVAAKHNSAWGFYLPFLMQETGFDPQLGELLASVMRSTNMLGQIANDVEDLIADFYDKHESGKDIGQRMSFLWRALAGSESRIPESDKALIKQCFAEKVHTPEDLEKWRNTLMPIAYKYIEEVRRILDVHVQSISKQATQNLEKLLSALPVAQTNDVNSALSSSSDPLTVFDQSLDSEIGFANQARIRAYRQFFTGQVEMLVKKIDRIYFDIEEIRSMVWVFTLSDSVSSPLFYFSPSLL